MSQTNMRLNPYQENDLEVWKKEIKVKRDGF